VSDRIEPVLTATAEGQVHVDRRLAGRRVLVVGGRRQSHGDPEAPASSTRRSAVLSGEAGYITGQTLAVDGGLSM
jgi:hypothetical protein